MANSKITGLPAAGALAGTEPLPVVQAAATKQSTISAILTYVTANISLAASAITSGALALARGGTGASLADPNADRIMFWDDSAGAVDWLTAGTGLSISGTTLNASGSASSIITDAATNTTTVAFTAGHNSSGTPDVSFGVGLKLTLESTTTEDQDAAQIESIWTTATHASRTSNLLFSTVTNAGSLAEVLRLIGASSGIFGWRMTGAASGGTPNLAVTTPTQAASAIAGTPLSINASNAVAGSSNAGSAAGGSITLTAGNAARLTSGNSNGGDINLSPGSGIGSGTGGSTIVGASTANTTAALKFGTTGTGFQCGTNQLQLFTGGGINTGAFNFTNTHLSTTLKIGWRATISDTAGSPDVALFRNAAAVLEVNNGTNGQWATLRSGTSDTSNASITNGLLLAHQRASGAGVAAGFGIGIAFNLESSTTQDQGAAYLSAEWVVATHASRTARTKLSVYDTAAREVLRGEASGSAAMIGFLGANAAIRQTAGAATAGAVYGATEQTMLQVAYDALRTFGLTT